MLLDLLALAATGVPLAALCLYERLQESRQIIEAALALPGSTDDDHHPDVRGLDTHGPEAYGAERGPR